MNNLLSYCGLVDAKIKASDKDLPVKAFIFDQYIFFLKQIYKHQYFACASVLFILKGKLLLRCVEKILHASNNYLLFLHKSGWSSNQKSSFGKFFLDNAKYILSNFPTQLKNRYSDPQFWFGFIYIFVKIEVRNF